MQRFSGEGLACRRGERLVFAGLGFSLAAGQGLLLQGANGSGKSSLLRLLAGLLRPEEGRLLVDGRPLGSEPERLRSQLHYLGHLDGVKPVLTAAENLAAWAGLAGRRVQGLQAALERLGLGALADELARFLSAGQKRRLALARLLAWPAPLWLLDEPEAALDAAAQGLLAELLRGHLAAGGLLVLAAHRPLLPEAMPVLELRSPAGAGAAW